MIKKVLFVLLFLGCSSLKSDYSNIKVLEVIDGDTVRLENQRLLRYIGIDTPEIRIRNGNNFIYKPQPFAEEAKEFNRKLVEGKTVRIEFDVEKIDKYGRLLGYVFVKEKFVNAKLLEEGYAVLFTNPPNLRYVELFKKLQKEAQDNKRGLWGAYEVIDSNMAYLYINQIRTVKGKVLNSYKTDKCIFLNFGKDYKKDFTIVIFKDNFKYFYERNIDPKNFYKGKTVQITGKIIDYNGAEIVARTPEDIEVINN